MKMDRHSFHHRCHRILPPYFQDRTAQRYMVQRCSLSRLFLQRSTLRRLSSTRFDEDFLAPRKANYVPLSVVSLLKHAATNYPNKLAYVHGEIKATWSDTYVRIKKLSSALAKVGVGRGDVVSIVAPNTPSMFEAHFAVPGCNGAVLHTVNTRLDHRTIAFQINHAQTKVLIVDSEFGQLVRDALSLLPSENSTPLIVDIQDPEFDDSNKSVLCGNGNIMFEEFLGAGDHENVELSKPNDEFDAIGLNYTSGSTGDPKGVVNHHRGAYLNAISNALELNMEKFAQYLWIVPMFHCNGWCFPWTMASVAGTSYFLRQVRGDIVIDLIKKWNIKYLTGAPIVMNIMLQAADEKGGKYLENFEHTVKFITAVIKKFQDRFGIEVRCAYGLTESHGISCFAHPDPEHDHPSEDEKLKRCTHQTSNILQEEIRVYDPKTLTPVPEDGRTIGEVFFRGNIVMKGYLSNENSTNKAFDGGWFRSGDLGVQHPNGRFQLKDRSKDIIISGGENISTIEVESIMLQHSGIAEVAVVAMPDPHWGEVPCAFITVKPDSVGTFDEIDIIKWAKQRLPGFMSPKRAVFLDLPKTSTGKVQKHVLRTTLLNLMKKEADPH